MKFTALMIAFFAVYTIALIYAILRNFDWYKFFDKRWGNDPARCKVYVDYGENEKFYDGDYVYCDDRYVFYEYKINKEIWAVAVPFNYKWAFVRGRRKILVNYGEGVAKPFTGTSNTTVGAVDLQPSLDSKLGVALVRSIKSRQAFKASSIILVIILLVVGYMFFRTYQENNQLKQQIQQNQVESIEQAIEQSGGELK